LLLSASGCAFRPRGALAGFCPFCAPQPGARKSPSTKVRKSARDPITKASLQPTERESKLGLVSLAEGSPVEITTDRLILTMLPAESAARQLAYFVDNREHLARWSPPSPPDYYTEEFWRWRLEENRDEYVEDSSCRLQMLERESADGAVVGQISFTAYTRGPHQSTNLGYSIDHRFEGKGLMIEGLRAAIDFAFGRLAFHRVAANYMPVNERSGRVLRKLGFSIEGYARDYLYLDGAWRDHVLTALYNPRPAPPGIRAFATVEED
jgi:ribosomal-protein-alanine N-acetyltransferase